MKKFKITEYQVNTEQLKQETITIGMISDLHNVELGEHNSHLLQALKEKKPDLICIAGDLVLGKPGATMKLAYEFLKEAVKIAPVYYGLGNHEQRMKEDPKTYGTDYLVFEKRIQGLGVRILENETASVKVKGEDLQITGLALSSYYYQKGKKTELSQETLKKQIGTPTKNGFQILLAHTPKYGDAYLRWGADLTLSGHYHGGMMRLPLLGGVISPDFRLFPNYCRGQFEKQGHHLVVSAGLGEHTIPLRIFNPRELVLIHCVPRV